MLLSVAVDLFASLHVRAVLRDQSRSRADSSSVPNRKSASRGPRIPRRVASWNDKGSGIAGM